MTFALNLYFLFLYSVSELKKYFEGAVTKDLGMNRYLQDSLYYIFT